MCILPFVIGAWHLDASIISWALWPGYSKGMLISLLDALALGTLLALPRQRISTPFVVLIVAYIAVAAFSMTGAQTKEASFFYVWQLLRMLLVFFAVSRIATQPQGPKYIVYGLAIGAILQAGVAISQRLHGAAQAAGTMFHQNSLGMALHFVFFPCVALLLAGRRDPLILLGSISGLICVVLTGSRATIGLAAAGVIILGILSVLRDPTSRKTGIMAVGVIALLAATPVAYFGLTKRLTADSIASSDSEREALKLAAWMIIADHPMGIGANEYVIIANSGGYSARAGVAWNGGSRAANVHNTYLLMMAELGYVGGAVFIALMLIPVWTVLKFAWANRTDPRGELALGLAMALAMVAAHCLFEWIYVTDAILYLHAICLGTSAGLIRQRRIERVTKARIISPEGRTADAMTS